jgi:hypothetical protein
MGYGVAMPTRSYRHMSAEERETLSLGLAHGHSLRTMASVLGRAPSTVNREHTRNAVSGTVSGLHGAHPGVGSAPSSAAAAQTPGSLAVAVRADAAGRGLLARADGRAAQPCVS